jgi:glycine cleavage system transcriptional repressor
VTYALLALGADRPGIVAGIAGVLMQHGINVEDSQMSILRGHFAMVLILAAPDAVELTSLRRDLEDAGRRLGLEAVVVNEVAHAVAERSEPTHAITVYGADHPGIVYAVSSGLAEADVNVTGMTTRVVGEDDPVYVMVLEISAPNDVDPETVLTPVAEEQSVEVSVRPLEAATL